MKQRFIAAVATAAMLLGSPLLPAVSAKTATATTQTQPPQGRLVKFKQALAQLNLTAAQKQQIKQILADAKTKLQATRNQAQSRPVVAGAVQKVIALLTPAQQTKLKQVMKSQKI